MAKNNSKDTIIEEKIVSRVTIKWEQTNMKNISCQDDTFLYAFVRGANLLYIGLANKQDVQTEVNQTIKRLEETNVGLVIYLGYIRYAKIEEDEPTAIYGIVKDTECLLIFKNQPVRNKQCKKSYTGRQPFTVVSNGLSLLKTTVAATIIKPKPAKK